jgi:DNA replication protein DnaC
MKRILMELKERREWDEQNPELSAQWNEALEEDHRFLIAKERENTMRIARERANDALHRLDVGEDAVVALRQLRDEPPVLAAKQFVKSDRLFLLLLGEVGTGKTVAAAYVLQEALAARYAQSRPSGCELMTHDPAMFLRASTFARMSSYDQRDKECFERICLCSMLAIDDLGTESANSHTANQMDELLDRRFSRKLRTVITSNLDEKTLAQRLGARAADRIGQYALVSNSKGASLRTGKRYQPQLKAVKT